MRDDNATTDGNSTGPAAPDVTDLGNDVFQIDTRMVEAAGITARYLIRGSRPCLVETGTAPSAPVVRDALRILGVGKPPTWRRLSWPIHLDHAGGAGDIAAMYPAAEIVVHNRGARHLADPSRLMASAKMVYGDALDRLFGTLAPVPADRIRALDDIGAIDLGDGRALASYYSPGHAEALLHQVSPGSTIGAGGLSFRVRDGTGAFPRRHDRRNNYRIHSNWIDRPATPGVWGWGVGVA